MRHGKSGGKGLAEIYSVYEIRGLNLDRFINVVKKRGVDLFDIKKYENKRLIVSVSYRDGEKFFAIAEDLCYNIKKVREKGKGYPLLALARSFGFIVGAAAFIMLSVFFNDVIFAFSFSGSGKIYYREVEAYLNKNGVYAFTRFSKIDTEKLEDGILADNPHLSFVSCLKRGNRLEISLALSQEKVGTLSGDVYELRADASGIVEKIKVYRGTAVVSEGDAVAAGDLLVDGYATVKDQTVKINVLASVAVIVSERFVYHSQKACEEENAVVLALSAYEDKEILNTAVVKTQENGLFVYEVTVEYRRVVYAG